MILQDVIKKPVITEKSLRDAAAGVFTFDVSLDASKNQVRKTVEDLFRVHVRKITSAHLKGKKRLTGKKRVPVYEKDRKKVWVKLAQGEKIDLFETGERK